VVPLPGEAQESWIAAYARRLHTTGSDLIAHLGLGGSRIAHMGLLLNDHEAAALERATGVASQALAAMTLEPYDGLAIAITPGRRALASRFPIGRFGNAWTRYCPQCLAHDQGRGPVTWRLPWSFACPLHRVLLLDFCPACRRPPRIWNARRLGPQAGAACTRDNPVTSARRGGCGTDLTAAEAVQLPAGGLVMQAHQHLASLMTSPPGSRPAAVTELREVYATAWRALRGLHAIPGQAPSAVHAVLGEIGAALPGRDGAEPGDDARTAAIGATLACLALDQTRPGHEELFGWILQAHRSLLKNRQYVPGIGAVARRWAWCGPGMVTKVLSGLDRDASLHARLRYATATPRPRWPALPAGAITRRAAMIPAMLWPGWTLRLLPRATGGADTGDDTPHSARCSSFRRGCASFLLLPGGPPQLNFERASPLLGNRSHVTDRDAVERILYRDRDLTPLASVLAQLASALDEHGSPIDYARRRTLFTGPESVTLDLDAYTRLCLQHGWSRSYAPPPGRNALVPAGPAHRRAPRHPRHEETVQLALHRLPLHRTRPAARLPPPAGRGQPRPARHHRARHVGTARPLGHLGGLARCRPREPRRGWPRRRAGQRRLRARRSRRPHADRRARPALPRDCRRRAAGRHRQRAARLPGAG
jgi:hypothetical protein